MKIKLNRSDWELRDYRPDDFYMLINASESGDYGKVIIQPVFIVTDREGERYRHYSDYTHNGEIQLFDFSISCQYNTRKYDDPHMSHRVPYAIRTGFAGSFTAEKFEEAEYQFSILKKLNKEIQDYVNENGNPDDFAAYVMMIAKIMGAKGFIIPFGNIYNNTFKIIDNKNVKEYMRYFVKEGKRQDYLLY